MSQVIKLAELAKCANMAAQENFTDRDYFLGRSLQAIATGHCPKP